MDERQVVNLINTQLQCSKFVYRVNDDDILQYKEEDKDEDEFKNWKNLCTAIWYEGEEEGLYVFCIKVKNEYINVKRELIDDIIQDMLDLGIEPLVDYPLPFRPIIKTYFYKEIARKE